VTAGQPATVPTRRLHRVSRRHRLRLDLWPRDGWSSCWVVRIGAARGTTTVRKNDHSGIWYGDTAVLNEGRGVLSTIKELHQSSVVLCISKSN